jgi:hypothetical protein
MFLSAQPYEIQSIPEFITEADAMSGQAWRIFSQLLCMDQPPHGVVYPEVKLIGILERKFDM